MRCPNISSIKQTVYCVGIHTYRVRADVYYTEADAANRHIGEQPCSSKHPHDWTTAETYRWFLQELPHIRIPSELQSKNGRELLSISLNDLEKLHLAEETQALVLSKVQQLKHDAENLSLLFALQKQEDFLLLDGSTDMETQEESRAAMRDEVQQLKTSVCDRVYAELLDQFNARQVILEQSDFDFARRYLRMI
jgi:hypothetical protein